MQVELTDALINQIIFLHSKKFTPKQIKVVTEVPTATVKRICNSKLAKKDRASNIFSWDQFKYNSAI